jgi:uncharacterized protein YdeI (YjbR/CyaY-like superfamily)
MVAQHPDVDAYIAQAPAFAQPILKRLRAYVHEACPAAREGRKWHLISFEGVGILCMMAAFKHHCSLVFWKGKLVLPPAEVQRLKRLTSLTDLPAKATLMGWLKTAVRIDQEGAPTPGSGAQRRQPAAALPEDLRQGLAGNPAAQAHFTAFAPGARRDYIAWLVEAKRPETRQKRLATALDWIAAGKRRNWKYEAPATGLKRRYTHGDVAIPPGPGGRAAARPRPGGRG